DPAKACVCCRVPNNHSSHLDQAEYSDVPPRRYLLLHHISHDDACNIAKSGVSEAGISTAKTARQASVSTKTGSLFGGSKGESCPIHLAAIVLVDPDKVVSTEIWKPTGADEEVTARRHARARQLHLVCWFIQKQTSLVDGGIIFQPKALPSESSLPNIF
ncbi:hypothetical protein Ancab_030040, partial [Ancistrocladus abbreviatus]